MRTSSLRMKTAALATALIFSASASFAESQPQFPIASLGSCASQEACHAYCNDPANMQACIDYAKQNGMMSQNQADDAQAYASLLAKGQGPGGCSSPDACDAYCSTVANMSACIDFAKAHDFSTPDIAIGEKMLAYIKSGGHMPGDCTSKSDCMAYCSQAEHMQECQTIFQAAGVDVMGSHPGDAGMPGGSGPSLELLQRFSTLEQQGKLSGMSCNDLQSCLTYCNDPSHGQECTAFSQLMGFDGSQAQFEQVHNTFQGPGGCTSKGSCDAYCSDPSHQAECQAIFEKQGNWQIGSSTGQQQDQNGQPEQQNMPSPGNCDSQASCQAYCSDPAHIDECQADFQRMGNWQAGSSSQSYNGSSTSGNPGD